METTLVPQSTVPNLFSQYRLGTAFDEMFVEPARPRPHYQTLFQRLQGIAPEEFRRRKTMTDLSMLQDGCGFTVYRQEEGIERVWPMDPGAADRSRERMAAHRDRAGAAADRPEPVSQGRLSRSEDPARRGDRRAAGLRGQFFRHEFVGAKVPKDIYIHICGTDLVRDDAGQLSGAGRQRPHALGRQLHAAKPAGAQTGFSANLRTVRRAGHRRLSGRLARRAALHRPQPPARTDHRAVDARAFSTRPISSTPSWPSAWASSWSKAAIWSSIATASSCAPRTGWRASTSSIAASTTIFSTRSRFGARQHAGRAGPGERLPRRQRLAGQQHRHRHRRRQGHLSLRARHDPLLPRRGSDPAQRGDVPAAGQEPHEPHPGEPRQAGGQDGQRVGRLRHADRPGLDRRPAGRIPRADPRPARAITSPSPRSNFRSTRLSSKATWKGGTSTCGRSCSAAKKSRSCPER